MFIELVWFEFCVIRLLEGERTDVFIFFWPEEFSRATIIVTEQ